MRANLAIRVSEFLIGTLIFVGLVGQVFVIPYLSAELAQTFVEYANDQVLIQVMLTAVVLSGQITLGLIWLLLRRIRLQRLLTEATLKWVKALAASLISVGAAFIVLFAWLALKNTMPPSLAIALLLAVLVSATAALVTIALKQVLQEANSNRLELEGVI